MSNDESSTWGDSHLPENPFGVGVLIAIDKIRYKYYLTISIPFQQAKYSNHRQSQNDLTHAHQDNLTLR